MYCTVEFNTQFSSFACMWAFLNAYDRKPPSKHRNSTPLLIQFSASHNITYHLYKVSEMYSIKVAINNDTLV